MNKRSLMLNLAEAENYSNNSQIARVVTEYWMKQNMYCPACGNDKLTQFPNNSPVADFFCDHCNEQFELKAMQKKKIPGLIISGEYQTMCDRLSSDTNPNLFLLNYNITYSKVIDLIVIPKYYFVPSIIIPRNPLSQNAKCAGWQGCSIDIDSISNVGKLKIVSNDKFEQPETIIHLWDKSVNLIYNSKQNNRYWLSETLAILEKIKEQEFSLSMIYEYENNFTTIFPNNNNVKAKIRQQLQILRNKGYLTFLGNGKYRKLS